MQHFRCTLFNIIHAAEGMSDYSYSCLFKQNKLMVLISLLNYDILE